MHSLVRKENTYITDLGMKTMTESMAVKWTKKEEGDSVETLQINTTRISTMATFSTISGRKCVEEPRKFLLELSCGRAVTT